MLGAGAANLLHRRMVDSNGDASPPEDTDGHGSVAQTEAAGGASVPELEVEAYGM